MKENLTRKEEIFVLEYVKDFNKTKAAIRAGYKPKGASDIGYKLSIKPAILEKIDQIFEDRKKELKFSHLELIAEAKHVAFSRMRTYVRVHKGKVELVETDRFEDGEDAAVQSYSVTHGGSTSVKLHDKIRGLELYAKLLGIFNEDQGETKDVQKGEDAKAVGVKMTPDDYLQFLMRKKKDEIPSTP